ncbi:MAG: AAA family ATPase [Actinomycetota bacterium]|nr:AAA family ATPase [Actinomycetota bacterium]
MILERGDELAELGQLLNDLHSSGGRVVLVRGEAGIGKSALVAQFMADVDHRAHVHMGTCDDLLTPQPLGPIWDLARQESSLVQPLSDGHRRAVMESVLDLLSRSLRPTVLVLEDTQWADEATLDLIKYLGRRVARTNGILILTYRDGEVDADHPLRQVIGGLPPQNLVRMSLKELSPDAVASMIDEGPFNLDEVLALTDGNPLFVTEVLASGVGDVPSSVQDSVLARAAKVSPEARRILDLVSVVPGGAERSVVDEILDPTEEQLAECVRQGLLQIDDTTVAFPHDLQRRAVESSLASTHRRQLNQRMLNALGDDAELSLLVHHAREANNVEAIVEFAPRAARAAMAIQSAREAVAHFRILEPCLGRLEISDRAAVLEDWGREESYLDSGASLALLHQAVELRRTLDDDRALARSLVSLARIKRSHLQTFEALDCVVEAVGILESYGPSADLTGALSLQALINWLKYEDVPVALLIADKAMAVAKVTGDEAGVIRALYTKGSILHGGGDKGGMSLVEESLRLAERGGHAEDEVRALMNLAGMSGDDRDVERATDFARRARDTAARSEMLALETLSQGMYSEFLLWKGAWAEAENTSSESVGSTPATATLAWRVMATLQARRGRSEARSALDRMWSPAQAAEVLTAIDPAASALAEYMWLSGDEDPAWRQQLRDVLEMGLHAGRPWPSGAFAFWMWKLGLLKTVPEGTADFYGWIIKGEYKRSAAFWRERGIPYEEGLALMHGDGREQIEAIRIFEDLGATATANKVRRTLMDQGVKVPRGKSQATRDHAAGLTARQAEILDLLAEGLTNTQIADRLFVSHRTVENHVSAVLMKLDVPDRDLAVSAARDQGILSAP